MGGGSGGASTTRVGALGCWWWCWRSSIAMLKRVLATGAALMAARGCRCFSAAGLGRGFSLHHALAVGFPRGRPRRGCALGPLGRALVCVVCLSLRVVCVLRRGLVLVVGAVRTPLSGCGLMGCLVFRLPPFSARRPSLDGLVAWFCGLVPDAPDSASAPNTAWTAAMEASCRSQAPTRGTGLQLEQRAAAPVSAPTAEAMIRLARCC